MLFLRCSIVAGVECPASGSVAELFGTVGKDIGVSMQLTVQKDHLTG
jgi:hypothetical protein